MVYPRALARRSHARPARGRFGQSRTGRRARGSRCAKMTRLALALIAAFSASPVWAQAPISQPLFHGSAHDCDDPNFSGHLPSGFVCRGTGTGSGIRAKTNDNHVVIYNIAPSINSTEGLCYLDLFPVGRYEMKQTLQYLRCKGAMPDCSIAEGQAGNQADQFGVAATIQNRLDQGFAGSSSGAYGIATQAGQFSAFPNRLVTPTPYTDALAGALLNGNLSDFGSTGNATYYNATGYAYPNLGLNSFGSGSNAYSDQFNGPGGQPIGTPPTSNFQLPQWNGATAPASTSSDGASESEAFDPSSGIFASGFGAPGTFAGTTPAGISTQGSGDFYNLGAPSAPGSGGAGNSVSVSGNQAPFSDDITNFSVAGVNAPPASGVSTAAAPQGTAPTATGGSGSNAGAPLDITNAQQVGDQAAGTIAQGATTAANTLSKLVTGAGQAVQSSEANFAPAGTSWLGSIFSAGTSLFVRGGFVALGLVLILGAFVFFYAENRQKGEQLPKPPRLRPWARPGRASRV